MLGWDTGTGPRPQPRNHGGVATIGHFYLWVEMPNPLKRLVAHPRTVVADVILQGRTRRAKGNAAFFYPCLPSFRCGLPRD